MSNTPVANPSKSTDLSREWLVELKKILGAKSRKGLDKFSRDVRDVLSQVGSMLPVDLDIADSGSVDAEAFTKSYDHVHKLLGQLEKDLGNDLGVFALEYQSIIAAARSAKDQMSSTRMLLVQADLKEFENKLKKHKDSSKKDDHEHDSQVKAIGKAVSNAQAEAKKNGTTKKDELELIGLKAEYAQYGQLVTLGLGKLKELSSSGADDLFQAFTVIDLPTQGSPDADQLKKAIEEIKTLEQSMRQQLVYGATTLDDWKKHRKEVREKIEQAQELCPLDAIKGFNTRYGEICDRGDEEKDYLVAAVELRTLRLDVEAQIAEQTKWKKAFKVLSDLCSEQVEELDKTVSPRISDQLRGEYFESKQYGVRHEYHLAADRLGKLAAEMARVLQETAEAAKTWEADKKRYQELIDERLDNDGVPENSPLRLKIQSQVKLLIWMGDTQRAYQQAKKELQELVDKGANEILKDVDKQAQQRSDAKEQAKPFLARLEQITKRLAALKAALKDANPTGGTHVGSIEDELNLAHNVIYGLDGELLLDVALTKALVAADKQLTSVDKSLDDLLGDTSEAQQNLQTMIDQEAAALEYEKLWKAWADDRRIGQGLLDTLAKLGGEKYLELRKIFESADQLANDSAAKFKNYLAMFPLTLKNQDKAGQLFGEVKSGLTQAQQTVGGSSPPNDDDFFSQATKAAIGVRENLDQGLKDAAKRLKSAYAEVSLLASSEDWLALPSFCAQFQKRGVVEAKEALAYEDSTNPGAIDSATRTLEMIASEFRRMLDDVDVYLELNGTLKEIKKTLSSDSALRKCCPTLRKELQKQVKEQIEVDLGKVEHAQARQQLENFRKQSVEPAIAKAARIARSRELGKEIGDKIEKLMESLIKTNQFPKKDCGAYSDLLQRRRDALEKTEDDEVAKNAADGLVRLLENLEKDSQAEGFADKVKGQITTREKNQSDRDKRVKEFERKLDEFLQADVALAKQSPQADKQSLKMIKSTAKSARELAQAGEFASAEERFESLRQLTADLIGAPAIKPISDPAKFIKSWDNFMENIHKQISDLIQEVSSKVAEHFPQDADPEKVADAIDTTFTTLMTRLQREFVPKGELSNQINKALTTLGDEVATLADMKREREQALRVIRHYKALLASDPMLAQLKTNPFDTKIGTAGFGPLLNEIEYQVVVTT